MKKMKKLLSVLLAVIMALSCMTIMASAKATNYKTVDNLKALNAYSPYGQVSRLSTEARVSMLFDFLDGILEDANIYMPNIVNIDLWLVKIQLTIDFRSIDGACKTITDIKSKLKSLGFALGDLGDLDFTTWPDTAPTRESYAQADILKEIVELLGANANWAKTKIQGRSISLGSIVGMFLDTSFINDLIGDLPSMIKGMLFGLFERWDDTTAEINALKTNSTGDGGFESTLLTFVNNLFTNDMSITTVKADSTGNITSKHTKLPGADADSRCRYIKNGDTITVQTYVTNKLAETLGKTEGEYYTTAVYVLREEVYNGVSTGDYVFGKVEITDDGQKKTDDSGEPIFVGENLKYYDDNSPLLPSLAADLAAGKVSIDLATNSAAGLLYKFIPYVFNEMAPVVLNGSLKKILASWFGARFDYVGEVGDDAVNALYNDTQDQFFKQEQGEYLWEWSDYKVINGNHYYRFEDQIFAADLSNTNPYFKIINWDYNIAKGFMNDFIPASVDSESNTILKNLNAFVIKVANEVLVASATFMDGEEEKTFTRPTLATNGNASLIENIKVLARAILAVSPASIFGSNYADGYYKLIAEGSNDDILTGVACMIIDLVMPQMTLPAADKLSGVKVGAILASVVRELATQLLPGNNYDKLIYSDYTTKAFLKGETYTNSYWLDVLLTMGTDIGIYYLKNLADMGEDTTAWAGMTAAGYAKNKTYTAADLNEISGVKPWEAKVDYIVDWALQSSELWAWKFEKFVDTKDLTIDMATVQDPWVKLDKILFDLLPIEEILNVGTPASGETRLEYVLRDRFILALVDLDWQQIVGGPATTGLLQIPTASVLRKTDVLTQVVLVVRDLLNGLLYKVANGNLLDTTVFVGLDEVFNQANIGTLVGNLLGKLLTAYNNGLLDPVLPIVGFFLGWQTNPQKFADPSITFAHSNNRAYLNGKATTINIRNTSSGMLETHRADAKVDGKNLTAKDDLAYIITISGVTCDDSTFSTTQTFPVTVVPGGKASIPYTYTSTDDKVVTFEITYTITGKDGNPIGGTQKKVVHAYKTETISDSETVTAKHENDRTTRPEYNPYIFTKNIYSSVTEYTGRIFNNQKMLYSADFTAITTPDNGVDMNDLAKTYFRYVTLDEWKASSTRPGTLAPGEDNTFKMYMAKEGVTGATKFPTGYYDMGIMGIKYRKNTKLYEVDFIYYDDHNVDSVFTNYENKNVMASDYDMSNPTVAEAYNTYIDALKVVAKDATMPKMKDTYLAECDTFETHIKALEDAYKNLEKYAVASGASASSVRDQFEAALKAAEGTDGINFQDYYLYEYFNYHDVRQIVYNRMDEYKAPAAPTNTLWTVSGSTVTGEDYDNAVEQISAKGEKYALAIKAAAYKPSQADIDNYNIAIDQWKAPTYTELDNDDLIAKLGHYRSYVIAKGTANKQFLDKEITAAAANYGTTDTKEITDTNAKYSTKTWAAFYDAYTNAVDVNADANALQSEVFQAKWDLMVAEKNLIEATKSVLGNPVEPKELTALKDAVATADAIFADPATYPVKADVVAPEGFVGSVEEYAYSQLLKARGVTYTNTEGDSVVLFGDSAEEYLTWDRENTKSNLNRIETATNNLNAAIALFDAPANDITIDGINGGVVTEGVENAETGIIEGYIYGITAGDAVADSIAVTGGYTEYIASDLSATGTINGTGALVRVYSDEAKTNLVAEYTVIVFGDVNGDAAVEFSDFDLVLSFCQGVLPSDIQMIAGDVDGATSIETPNIDPSDYDAVLSYCQGVVPPVNPYN